MALLALSVLITVNSVNNLQARNGLPLINQAAGWIILSKYEVIIFTQNFISLIVSASSLPFVYPVRHISPSSKILVFFLAFAVCFVILSISVEGLFYTAYAAVLVCWIEVEAVLRDGKALESREGSYRPRADDLRIAVFFLFFVQVAFFGTGK